MCAYNRENPNFALFHFLVVWFWSASIFRHMSRCITVQMNFILLIVLLSVHAFPLIHSINTCYHCCIETNILRLIRDSHIEHRKKGKKHNSVYSIIILQYNRTSFILSSCHKQTTTSVVPFSSGIEVAVHLIFTHYDT